MQTALAPLAEIGFTLPQLSVTFKRKMERAAILSILGTIILGLPIPYAPAQVLSINLVTHGR
jgi:predicted membrane protein